MGAWTPTEVIEITRLVIEGLFFIVGLIGIFLTKSDVKSMRKDVDGRFSQLLDLVGRLSGVPDRRIKDERRAGNGETPRA